MGKLGPKFKLLSINRLGFVSINNQNQCNFLKETLRECFDDSPRSSNNNRNTLDSSSERWQYATEPLAGNADGQLVWHRIKLVYKKIVLIGESNRRNIWVFTHTSLIASKYLKHFKSIKILFKNIIHLKYKIGTTCFSSSRSPV